MYPEKITRRGLRRAPKEEAFNQADTKRSGQRRRYIYLFPSKTPKKTPKDAKNYLTKPLVAAVER